MTAQSTDTDGDTDTDTTSTDTTHDPGERQLDIPVDLSRLTDAQASILHEAACDPNASFVELGDRARVSPKYVATTLDTYWPTWRQLDGDEPTAQAALDGLVAGDDTGLDTLFGDGTAEALDEVAEALDELLARLEVLEDRAGRGGDIDAHLDTMETRMNAFSRAADAIRDDVAALEDTLGTVNDDAQAALDTTDRNAQRLDRVERDVVAANDDVADVSDRLDALGVTVGAMHQRLARVEAHLDDGADDREIGDPFTGIDPAADAVDELAGEDPPAESDDAADEADANERATWGSRLFSGWGDRL